MQDHDRIAGIDVHKTMLAVVVMEGTAGACRCVQKAKFGAMESELRRLSSWLTEVRVAQRSWNRRRSNGDRWGGSWKAISSCF